MTSVQQGTLHAAGASLFYRSCGRGAPVLIIAGGDADADATEVLRDALADRHRVITYDRRGLSRSRPDPGAPAADIATHAEDAHHLLAALTEEPAYVFAAGLGGLIGLDLIARHPEQVKMLVVHEAPTPQLLPTEARLALTAAQQTMFDAFRTDGVAAALRLAAELAGVDPEDREPDVASPASGSAQAENSRVTLAVDLPAIMAYRLDLPALDVQAHKIVPAGGQSNRRRTLPHQCAAALADILERPLAEFPGGHTGWLLRPRAFAGQLAQTFANADRRDWRLGDGLGPRPGGRT